MNTQTEALKLSLEAITQYLAECPDPSEEAVEGLCDAASVAREALAQPEPYDQTALELCNVCGWKTLIPDDACLNCERAQPEQEPVAWIDEEKKIIYWHNTHETDDYHGFKRTTPLYTTPPQRTWVELTDEELPPLVGDNGKYMELQQVRRFYKYIEAKLKEKNT